MFYDLLVEIFGENIIAGLDSSYLAILALCIMLLVSWIAIKLFQALGATL